MFPEGLKRASVAKSVKRVPAPCESATTLFIGRAEGVASNTAVNVPVCTGIGVSWKPVPAFAVTQGEVTARVTDAECERLPLVPLIAGWEVPIGVEAAV